LCFTTHQPRIKRVLPQDFKLLVNLKTVKALGLTVPRQVLAGVDEFIE
jgi:hypothetical protein